jgi:hypothetical protein
MHTTSLCLTLLLLSSACSPAADSSQAAPKAGAPTTLGFTELPAGPVGAPWRQESTKAGEPVATWVIQADETAPSAPQVLALERFGSAKTFNLCWNPELRFKDGTVEVSLRSLSGEVDQGGGPAWRVRGAGDYYVCRINPLEKNFRLYVVVGGERKQLASADMPELPKPWTRIQVEHVGEKIRCKIDGKVLLEATDATLPEEGGVGVWTKADARTAFDDLAVGAR